MPPQKRIVLFLALLTLLPGAILFSPSPCFSATQQYLYHPVYYPTVEEAYAAVRNMRGQFVGWKGTPPQKIELDRYGLTISGSLDYTTTTKEWVGGTFNGSWKDVQKPVHLEELNIIPFDRLVELQLNHYADLEKEYKWGVCAVVKGSNDPPAFRTPTRELAEILYNAIASFAAAAGHPVNMARVGAYFRDVTSEDVKSKDLQAMGLTEPNGMVVTFVMEDSPAKTGGMQVGDILVACNDTPLINYGQWYRDVWPKAGSMAFKALKKDGAATRLVEAVPADKLPKPPATLTFIAPASTAEGQKPPKLGLSLRIPNDAEKQAMKGKPGAVVSAITPGGLAEAARLQVGDILLECNGKPIPGPEGLGALLTPKENAFTVMRKGNVLTVKLAPEVSY